MITFDFSSWMRRVFASGRPTQLRNVDGGIELDTADVLREKLPRIGEDVIELLVNRRATRRRRYA